MEVVKEPLRAETLGDNRMFEGNPFHSLEPITDKAPSPVREEEE